MVDSIAKMCVALLALLYFGLSFAIVLMRFDRLVPMGESARESLLVRLSIAHVNSAEYVPILAILCVCLSFSIQSSVVHGTMLLAVLCRYLFVVGMLLSVSPDSAHPVRLAGSLGTYVFGVLLIVALLRSRA